MLPKGKKESESAQTVLVRTINPISSGYFAVYKRDLRFFSRLRTKSSCTIAPIFVYLDVLPLVRARP